MCRILLDRQYPHGHDQLILRGIPKINVTFQLDVNGLLSVSAREEQSGQEQSIKIEGASTLARDGRVVYRV